MKWYVADKKFVSYLQSIDSKVENIEYENTLKPYFGIVLNVNGFSYYLPVSSAKPKHVKMKNSKDFMKLIDPKTQELIAVLNINNMIPIPSKYIKKLEYDEVDKYKTFSDSSERAKYIDLLRKELDIIKSMSQKIQENAEALYNHLQESPEDNLSQRCCNFPKLEKAIIEYKE